MPVRTLKKSYRGQPSYHMTPKAEHTSVFCESTYERKFYTLLKFFKWVYSYEEQPFKVPYIRMNGGVGRWTPDTLITLHLNGYFEKWLCEVKLRSDLKENWTEYKPKFRGALYHCKKNDIKRFKLITEVEILSGSTLKNISLFLKNRNSRVDSGMVDYTTNLLANCVTMETRALLENLWSQGVEENDACVLLYHLIANHVVGVDIEAPFTYRSKLWMLPDEHQGLGLHLLPKFRSNIVL